MYLAAMSIAGALGTTFRGGRATAALLLLALFAAMSATVGVSAQGTAVEADAPKRREIFPLQDRRSWSFEEEGGSVAIDNEFSGARVNACERVGPLDYKIVSSPENLPINPSPWFAFRVTSAVEREITVRIVITASKSRPRPHVSRDGGPFERVATKDWEGGEGAKECVLRVRVGPAPTIVASNHLIGVAEIEAWTDMMAKRLSVEPREIGRSMAGRAIRAFEFGAADTREVVVVIGRQHPPEVSGSVGLSRFIEAIAADTEIARAFRARFRILCVPLVNPDGVHEGNWRSTLDGIDANRDWGPFTQIETRVVRDAILAFAQVPGRKARLLLDFHATSKDIFYVPPEDAALDPPNFAPRWLDAIARRFPDYAVESSAAHNVKEWTFKRWAFETFAAPGITYELGSATPHERIARIVTGAAEEAMRLLLESGVGARAGAEAGTGTAVQEGDGAERKAEPVPARR
jgi:predicted deacylase